MQVPRRGRGMGIILPTPFISWARSINKHWNSYWRTRGEACNWRLPFHHSHFAIPSASACYYMQHSMLLQTACYYINTEGLTFACRWILIYKERKKNGVRNLEPHTSNHTDSCGYRRTQDYELAIEWSCMHARQSSSQSPEWTLSYTNQYQARRREREGAHANFTG